jgi:anaphase-promoting complex subunit 2
VIQGLTFLTLTHQRTHAEAKMAAKRRVFDSVFQFSGAISQPTPDLDFTVPGQAFGGPLPFAHDRTQAPESLTRAFNVSMNSAADVRDQIAWDQSWHTATSFLVLPFTAGVLSDHENAPLPAPSPAFHSALKDVLDPETRLPHAAQTEDLILWYSQQVRYHFLHEVLAVLSRASDGSNPEAVLPNYVKVLQRAHRIYLHGLSFIVNQLDDLKPGTSHSRILAFRRDLHALVSNSISSRISGIVKAILSESISTVLGIPSELPLEKKRVTQSAAERSKVHNELLNLVESLHDIGLGGEKLKIMFAEVMNEAMTDYVQHTYSRVWSKQSVQIEDRQESQTTSTAGKDSRDILLFESIDRTPHSRRTVNHGSLSYCTKDLCEWVENTYSTLIIEILRTLDQTEVDWIHVDKWKKMSIGRLAGLRTQELFDIVENWPDSNGALDDLRTAIDTPQRRLQLTDVFSVSLKERLLHPGTSTLQILRTYISMIWSFHSLDHSKVLLDRVAYPLQVYLCSREDTVRIIIAGLLSDTEDASGFPIEPGGDKLTELAILLNKGAENLGQQTDEGLDWNDMDWVPDPVDAGPGYKRSKNADVIGTLIGVLGSQEVFIKEFQNIVGENLLRSEGDFEKEVCYNFVRSRTTKPHVRP